MWVDFFVTGKKRVAAEWMLVLFVAWSCAWNGKLAERRLNGSLRYHKSVLSIVSLRRIQLRSVPCLATHP